MLGSDRIGKAGLEEAVAEEQVRTMPSPTAVREYLELFHDEEQEKLRAPHTAFIPGAKKPLAGLVQANAEFVAGVQRRAPEKTATLDMDATIVETHKREALYCYKNHKAYQPLNIYWSEQGLVVLSEFRDGNVPANFDLLRPFKRALELVPASVKKVYLRSDAAGYQWDLLKYCAEAKSKRFGAIEFAVGVDVTAEFKRAVREVAEADWRPLPQRPGPGAKSMRRFVMFPGWWGIRSTVLCIVIWRSVNLWSNRHLPVWTNS